MEAAQGLRGRRVGLKKGEVEVEQSLEDEIRASLVNGKLPCGVAFKIAKRHGLAPKQVGDAANKLNIKIAACQLGCFP